MNIKSLKIKTTLTDDEGDKYVDLSVSSFQKQANSSIKGLYVVTEETEMRPDLICMKYYGNTEYIDALLKSNNITNPFALKEGDLLFIPSINEPSEVYVTPGEIEKTDLREQFIDSSRLSEKDKGRIDRLKEKAKGKKGAKKELLPPNILESDQKGFKIKGDELIFGVTR